jgi:hypothetical protein
MIVHLIIQLCFGAYNPKNFLLSILNLVLNKMNALIKFANKLVSLSTGLRNEIHQSLYSIHRNTCMNSASGRL